MPDVVSQSGGDRKFMLYNRRIMSAAGLATRQREAEWMDEPGADPVMIDKSLRFIRRVNRFLAYTRATISHLERFSARWRPGERIEMIDFATGSADIPLAILRWADARGFDVRIVGVDLHAATAQLARQSTTDSRLKIVRADVLDLPFEANQFDYALTAMFLHHLSDEDVVRVMHAMGRVSRRGVIVSDLVRDRRALAWIKLFTIASNPMVKHDAVVSVRQAFTREEICGLRDRAGIGYAEYFKHFGHRFVMAGEKAAGHDSTEPVEV
jgi:ubiquinone/menaquinone biosynthesis C-methylase UbiE